MNWLFDTFSDAALKAFIKDHEKEIRARSCVISNGDWIGESSGNHDPINVFDFPYYINTAILKATVKSAHIYTTRYS